MPTYIYTTPKGRRVSVRGDSEPTPEQLEVIFREAGVLDAPAESASSNSPFDVGPAIGATVGGFALGAPGAMLGGAAGRGYQTLVERASEIPSAVTDVLGNVVNEPVATMRGFVEGAKQGATDMAIAGGVSGALDAVGGAVMRGIGGLGRAAYRGYLKPSLAESQIAKAPQIVDTLIDEAIPLTESGSQRAQQVISELRAEVKRHLAQSSGRLDLKQVADRVRQFARQKYYKPGVPVEGFDAAMRVADNIDNHPSLGLPPGARPTRVDVSMTQADDVKRGIGTSVGDNNFGVDRGATKSTQKRAYAVMRQGMESKVPEIRPLNRRESRLIDAAKALDRAIGREGNKSLVNGVTTLMSGAIGAGEYARTGDPYVAATEALIARTALAPSVATRAAIVAARLGKTSGAAPATVARAVVAALSEADEQSDNIPSEPGEQP